jgi:hypothetical protein
VLYHSFIKRASELSGAADLKTFAEQWIFCDGYPLLHCEFVFNRKKHATELRVTQRQHTRPGDLGLKFSGQLVIRIHEVSIPFMLNIDRDNCYVITLAFVLVMMYDRSIGR